MITKSDLELISCRAYVLNITFFASGYINHIFRFTIEILSDTVKTICASAVKNFNKEEHHMSDFEFIVIEKIVNESDNNIDRRLLTREAFWCSQLCTLQPYGLNKRSEFNSKNRIRFN